jgi:hypothetical protein
MWNRARQYWTDPMWIRVTDQVKAPEFIQVNEPELGMVMQPVAGPDGQPVIDQFTGQPAMQPGIGVVKVNKRLAEMDMDLILDQTDDSANLQQEVWGELMELLRLGMSPFSPEFEIAIEMSPIGDKQRILERLKAKSEEMQQAQGEQGQQQAQDAAEMAALMKGKTQAEIAKIESETAENAAQTQEIEARTAKVMLEPFKGVEPMGYEGSPDTSGLYEDMN